MTIDEYILSHISPEGDYLHRLYRATNIHLLYGRMASGHLQGRLLKMIVEMTGAKRILEVGTFSGYSAICLAEGIAANLKNAAATIPEVSPSGKSAAPFGVVTFEINDELEPFTRKWIEGSPVGYLIDFRIGDAKVEAPKLGIEFDLAFLDGNKRTYIEDYEMAMSVTRPGGYILADNTLWDGHVLEEPAPTDRQTKGIMEFNDYVKDDKRVETVILPLRDGLTLIKKV